ncbi:MAG: histidine kinase [Clostridiales bacterium]|nr:histidine kinase [Clostridiales bacterium]
MKDKISKIFEKNTIRSKVIRFVFTLIIFFILSYFFNQYVTSSITKNFNEVFIINLELEELTKELDKLESSLEDYINTKDSDSFIEYSNSYSSIESKVRSLDKGLSFNISEQSRYNITQIINKYLETTDSVIELKRARNTEAYLLAFDEVKDISRLIKVHINDLNEYMIKINLEQYQKLSEGLVQFNSLFLIILIIILLLTGLFIYDFTKNILTPIETLSDHAKEISNGNYIIDSNMNSYFKEANILHSTFVEMAININIYIEELKEKSEVENKLAQIKIENLRVENQLKISELKALQSQINPHFLFNTLNAGVQLANLEDAERTAEFIYNLSRLFRYNIQSLEKEVSLKEELKNVKSYFHLMKVRFDDLLDFSIDIQSDNTDKIFMPPLILQPIIENAIIHGFKDKTETGVIRILVSEKYGEVSVVIEDNGIGIPENLVQQLNDNYFNKSESTTGHTTGIGLENVYSRLSNYFNNKNVLKIESEVNCFTKIYVYLGVKDEI